MYIPRQSAWPLANQVLVYLKRAWHCADFTNEAGRCAWRRGSRVSAEKRHREWYKDMSNSIIRPCHPFTCNVELNCNEQQHKARSLTHVSTHASLTSHMHIARTHARHNRSALAHHVQERVLNRKEISTHECNAASKTCRCVFEKDKRSFGWFFLCYLLFDMFNLVAQIPASST